MKRFLITIGLACLLAGPAVADFRHGAGINGGSADWTRIGGYYNGQGGEFTLYNSNPGSLLLTNAGYAAATRVQDNRAESFQTFCVEISEFIYAPMDIWESTQFLNGSTGSHEFKGGGNGVDLAPATAWIYTQFAQGTLPGYNYVAGPGRISSAETAQMAIWFLQNQITAPQLLNGAEGIVLTPTEYAQALAWIAAGGQWTGIGNVRVLQTGIGDGYYQDQLYLAVPAPAAGLLGVIGLSLVGWVKRRLA